MVPVNALPYLSSFGQMRRVLARKAFAPKPANPLPNITAPIYYGGKGAAIP